MLPKTLKIIVKWQKFAKYGHTGCRSKSRRHEFVKKNDFVKSKKVTLFCASVVSLFYLSFIQTMPV